MTGKGSKPRPYSVPLSEFDRNHERIFGRKDRRRTGQADSSDRKADRPTRTDRRGAVPHG